jgi:transcriptional antiterminator RfaH
MNALDDEALSMLRWYLILTKPLGERIAQANLERQGYEVYLPRLIKTARRNGNGRACEAALFPRYLFLRLSEGYQPLSPVHSSVGVSAVVRFGSRYAVVPEQVIHDLREREDPETGLHRLTVPPPLTLGTPVKVTMGPFDGLEGVFERGEGPQRVVILLKLLGQDVPVRAPADFILPSRAA